MDPNLLADESTLVSLALGLGAERMGGPLSVVEVAVVKRAMRLPRPPKREVDLVRASIRAGGDPLGDQFCEIRPAVKRRKQGAFFTPPAIVEPMVRWILDQAPIRVVDPGCGSGRFAMRAISLAPEMQVVAIDVDPVATLLTRAGLAVLGATRARVICGSYLSLALPVVKGRTAYLGNPPYVRHHDLTADTKKWATDAGAQVGHGVSALAGLHALFFLATALHAEIGDVGSFVTSAEWLDTGYGSLVRGLLLNGLGGQALDLVDPRAIPFADAMTTALITCFEVGSSPHAMRLDVVNSPADLRRLGRGHSTSIAALAANQRWTHLVRDVDPQQTDGLVPLSNVARVHRGVATGANGFFVLTKERAESLGLAAWCRPAVTRADEILTAPGGVIRDNPDRCVILDLPFGFDRESDCNVDKYLTIGEELGIHKLYLASHRRPWWRLGVPEPPPIVASYMARQPPAFALNPDRLVIVNVAHGIYPVVPLGEEALASFVERLNAARAGFRGSGRTYHGGLEKFEPREMEALLIKLAPE